MPNVEKVSVGVAKVAGAIFRGPTTAQMPTSASTELPSEFVELGYASEDGLENNDSYESTTVHAWGGTPVLDIKGKKVDTFKLRLLESLNPNVLKTVYGENNVTVSPDGKEITVHSVAGSLPNSAYIFEIALRNNALKRIVVPQGSLSERAAVIYKDDEPIGYEITISAMDDGSGKTHSEYIHLGDAIAAGT